MTIVKHLKRTAIKRMLIGLTVFLSVVPISLLLPASLAGIVAIPIVLLGMVIFLTTAALVRCPFCGYIPATEVGIDGQRLTPFFPDICPKCHRDLSKIEHKPDHNG
jgi:hypothetical protein